MTDPHFSQETSDLCIIWGTSSILELFLIKKSAAGRIDFFLQGKSAYKAPRITHLHQYRDIFFDTIYTQLQELNSIFDEINSELLCVACLDPRNSFRAFNKEKLVKLTSFYPK